MTKEQKSYNEGLAAGISLSDEDDCPYEMYSPEYDQWMLGYEDSARLRYDGMR